jgi:hypothetical protein
MALTRARIQPIYGNGSRILYIQDQNNYKIVELVLPT